MKKFKYILILLFLCLIPNKIEASCTSLEKARLKKIVSNINISYDYEIVDNDAVFSIKLNNLNSEIYFIDLNGKLYQPYDNEEVVLENYEDGKSYTLSFYGTDTCLNKNVGNLYINTPSYNPYYKLTVCDNAREFELCQRWASHSLTLFQFKEKVNEYKKIKGIIDDSEVKKEISIIDFAFSFIRMYGIYIAIGIAVIIFIIKFIRYKKDSFGF